MLSTCFFQDVSKRKRFVGLVDSVREFGGDVKIFSSLHVSGEQLDQLTGLCAVLRYVCCRGQGQPDSDTIEIGRPCQ